MGPWGVMSGEDDAHPRIRYLISVAKGALQSMRAIDDDKTKE